MVWRNLYLAPGDASGSSATLSVPSLADPLLVEAQKFYLQFLQTKPADVTPAAFSKYLSEQGSEYLQQNASAYVRYLLFRPPFASSSLSDSLSKDSHGMPLTLWERLSQSYNALLGPSGAVLIGGPDPSVNGQMDLLNLRQCISNFQGAKVQYDLHQNDPSARLQDKTIMDNECQTIQTLLADPAARSAVQMLLVAARLGVAEAKTQEAEMLQALAYSDQAVQDPASLLSLLAFGLETARTYASSGGLLGLKAMDSIDLARFLPNSTAYSKSLDFTGAQSLTRGYDIHYHVNPSKDFRPSYSTLIAGDFYQVALKQGFDEAEARVMRGIQGGRDIGGKANLTIRDFIDDNKAYNALVPESKKAYTSKDEEQAYKGYFGQNSMLAVVFAALASSDRNGALDLKSIKLVTDLYSKVKQQTGDDAQALNAATSAASALGVGFKTQADQAIALYAQLLAQPLVSISSATHEKTLPADFESAIGAGTREDPLRVHFAGLDPSYVPAQLESLKALYPEIQQYFNGETGDQSKKDALAPVLTSLGWSAAQAEQFVDATQVPIEANLWSTANQVPGQPSLSPYGISSYNETLQEALHDLRLMKQALDSDPDMLFSQFLRDYLKMGDSDLRVLQDTNPELSTLKLSSVHSAHSAELEVALGAPDAEGVYSGGALQYARVVFEPKWANYTLPARDAAGQVQYNSDGSVKTAEVAVQVQVPRECKKEGGRYVEAGQDFFYAKDGESARKWWNGFAFGTRRLKSSELNRAIKSDFETFTPSSNNWENFEHFMTLRLKLRRNYGVGLKAQNRLRAQLPQTTHDADAGSVVQIPAQVFIEGTPDLSGSPSFSRPFLESPNLTMRFTVLDPGSGKSIANQEFSRSKDPSAFSSSAVSFSFDTSRVPEPDFSKVSSFSSVGPAAFKSATDVYLWQEYRYGFSPTTITPYPYMVQALNWDPDRPLTTGSPFAIPLDRAYESVLFPTKREELNAQGLINVKATYPAEFSLFVRQAGSLLAVLPVFDDRDVVWAGRVDFESKVVRDAGTGLLDYDKSKGIVLFKLTSGASLSKAEVMVNSKPDSSLVVYRELPIKRAIVRYHQDEQDWSTGSQIGEHFYLTIPSLASTDLRRTKQPPLQVAEEKPILQAADLNAAINTLSKRGVSVRNQTQLQDASGAPIQAWSIETEPVPTPFPTKGVSKESGQLYYVYLNATGNYEVYRSRSVELSAPTKGRLELRAAPSDDPDKRILYDEFIDPSNPSRLLRVQVGFALRTSDDMWMPHADLNFAPPTNPGEALHLLYESPDPALRDLMKARYAPYLSSEMTDADGAVPAMSVQNTVSERIGVSMAPDYGDVRAKQFFENTLQELYQFKLVLPGADPDKTGLALKRQGSQLLDPSGNVLFDDLELTNGAVDTQKLVPRTDHLAQPAYRSYLQRPSAGKKAAPKGGKTPKKSS